MPSTLLSTSPAPPPDMTKRRGSSGDGVSANDWREQRVQPVWVRCRVEEEGGIDVIPAASGIVFEYVLSWSYGQRSYSLVEVGRAAGYQ
jgi:hypothetical protein